MLSVNKINKSKRTLREVNKNYTTMKWYFGIYAATLIFRYLGIYQLETKFGDLWW